jgi:hypothetical protein
MAKIVKTSLSATYLSAHEAATALGETNDCSVKALALVTGCTYEEAHEALRRCGRKNGQGVWVLQNMAPAARILGFRLRRMPIRDRLAIIQTYPERDRVLAGITTHHPRRFRRAWAAMPTMIFETSEHVAAFRDGELHDWSVNNAKRVTDLWLVERL